MYFQHLKPTNKIFMNKNILRTLAAMVLLLPALTKAQDQTYFAAYPALSPDAQTIVFSYDGDIWKVPTKGGVASRLTGMPGEDEP